MQQSFRLGLTILAVSGGLLVGTTTTHAAVVTHRGIPKMARGWWRTPKRKVYYLSQGQRKYHWDYATLHVTRHAIQETTGTWGEKIGMNELINFKTTVDHRKTYTVTGNYVQASDRTYTKSFARSGKRLLTFDVTQGTAVRMQVWTSFSGRHSRATDYPYK